MWTYHQSTGKIAQDGDVIGIGYSGNGREERVDHLYPDELSQFAERAALALLYDVPISSTINRENVLRADSLFLDGQVSGLRSRPA